MYDSLTSALLFLLLVPGVVLTLPPSGGIMAAVVHAVVFYVVQVYLSAYVPWWGIWAAAAVIVGGKLFMARSSAAPSY
jgi:hypothetical protein